MWTCPNCRSADLGRDAASQWPLIVAVLVLNVAGLFTPSGWPYPDVVKFFGQIFLAEVLCESFATRALGLSRDLDFLRCRSRRPAESLVHSGPAAPH